MTQERERVMNRKQLYILLTLSFLTFTAGFYKYFVGSGIRVNPFVFFDYLEYNNGKGMYLSIFLYELNYMITFVVVLFLCKFITLSKNVKNIISPFIWIASFDIIDYICLYKQLSYIKLPLLVILVAIYNRRWIYKSTWTSK